MNPGGTQAQPLVIAVVLAAGILAAAQVGKVPPLLPGIRSDLALGLVEAGWMTSLMALTGALFGATFGFVVDRLGAARMLLAGLALLVGAGLAGVMAPTGGSLAVSRALESIGLLSVVVSGPRLLYAAAPPRLHGLVLGLWGCYMPAGMALIMFAAPMLGSHSWRDVWLINAVLLAALLLAAGVVLRRALGPVSAGLEKRPSLFTVLRQPAPWILGLAFGLYSMQWFAVAAWLPTYLIENLGQTAAGAARIAAIVVAVNILGNIAGAWLIHRGTQRGFLVGAAFLAMALGSIGIFSGLGEPLLPIAAAVLFSGISGVLPAAVLAGAARHSPSPQQVGLISGIIVQGANLGSLAGPPATAAAVFLLSGWERLHWPLLCASGIGLALAFIIARVERRPTGADSVSDSRKPV